MLMFFSQVFPFAILLDPQMRIYHLGHSIKSVFPADTVLIGRHLEDVFRLVRPDILLEWSRVGFASFELSFIRSSQVLSYGRHIVFVIESKTPLRPNPSTSTKKLGSDNSQIRLKGQMKLIAAWNMIVFLCHPVYVLAQDKKKVPYS